MAAEPDQKGIAGILFLILILLGIILGTYLVHTKTNLFSKAYDQPGTSTSSSLQIINSSGESITTTDSPTVRVKLTDPGFITLCNPKVFSDLTWAVIETGQCKKGSARVKYQCQKKTKTQNTICPASSPKPASEIPAKKVVLAENEQLSVNKMTFDFTSNPMIVDYTFTNPGPGTKQIYAQFIASDNQIKIFHTTIEYSNTPLPQPALFKEEWTDLSFLKRWNFETDSGCITLQPGILNMTKCSSAGIRSKLKWDKNYPITLEGTVTAGNTVPGQFGRSYWGGLTLYDSPSQRYAELAATSHVQPNMGFDEILALTDEIQTKLTFIKPAVENQTYKFKVEYKKVGTGNFKYYYYVDGVLSDQAPVSDQFNNPDIFLLCVSFAAGSDGSRASCKFGPLTLLGVPVNSPPDYSRMSLQITPMQVKAGQNITVSWQNDPDPNKTDWLGVIPVENPQTYYGWIFAANCSQITPSVKPQENGSCTFNVGNTPPGQYKINYFLQNTHQSVSETVLEVTP